jgi:predicted transcriptional regulator
MHGAARCSTVKHLFVFTSEKTCRVVSVPTNKPRFSIQLDDDVAEKLRELAKADGRPIANYISRLINNALSGDAKTDAARKIALGIGDKNKAAVQAASKTSTPVKA